MGLKCSVIGHKYGDATVERDREEQGSEVVITIREIETCNRCGEERTVSENKEVTTLATPDEPVDADQTDDAGDDDTVEHGDRRAPARDAHGDTVGGSAGEPSVADDRQDATRDDDIVEPTDEPPIAETGVTDSDELSDTDESPPPVDATEGAEILEAEAGDAVADDELADPSIEDAGLGSDPDADEPVEEDAVIIGEDDPEDGSDRALGAWPEEPDRGDDQGWTPDEAVDDETPITAPDAGTEHNAAVTIPDGQFRCPECDYTTLVESSSLRAGDFCPDCRKGSLVHEPRDETRKE